MDRRESAALISIGCNILLVALKLFGASISGSLALLADAWHSSSDIAVSVLVWAGIKITRRQGEKRAEAGLIENGVAVVIALAIFLAAYVIFRKVYVAGGYMIQRAPVAIAITVVCILISLFISRYKIYVGRAAGSASLVADGQHSRMDMYTSIGVLVVLVGTMIGVSLDRVVAIVISLLILKVGIEVLSMAVVGFRKGEVLRFRPATGKGITGKLAGFTGRYIRRLAALPALILLFCYLLTGVTVVGPAERGLLKRFGRFVGGPKTPGFYRHWPAPVETIVKMEPDRVRRIEFGFRTNQAYTSFREPKIYDWESRHVSGRYRKVLDEALMLTGDENIIDMNFILHYQVDDMKKFLTRVSDEEKFLRAVAESSVRLIVGEDRLDNILTVDRDAVQVKLRGTMQERLDSLDTGLRVTGVWLQDVHPPIEVVPAFRDVASAREDRARIINEAFATHNDAVPRARGEAGRELANAEAYRLSSVEKARGDVALYLALLSAYGESPEVTRFRLVWETLEKALGPVEKYFLKPDPSGEAQLWLVPTGKRPVDLERIMQLMAE